MVELDPRFFPRDPGLRVLDLSQNGISEAGVQALLDTVEEAAHSGEGGAP